MQDGFGDHAVPGQADFDEGWSGTTWHGDD
jgi:hypothetical protein